MKKLILVIAVIFTIAFTSCTKENVQPTPTHKAIILADKSNLSQADDTTPVDPTNPPPATNDKSNLSQADANGGN